MTATLHRLSPREVRRDNTTWIRCIHTGHTIEVYHGSSRAEHDLQVYLGWFAKIENHTIVDGPCEGTQYITADGEPVAWIDEGPGFRFTTDEIAAAVLPMKVAAE